MYITRAIAQSKHLVATQQVTTLKHMASSSSTHGRDVPQLAARRRASDGNEYTAEEFEMFYGKERWEAFWDKAPLGDVAQLADDSANLDASNPGDVAQLADDFANLDASNTGGTGTQSLQVVRLQASDLIGVRRQEANRGPPRSLHNMARRALNAISQSSTYAEVNLDDWFEWIPYVAAHAESEKIVGPGIKRAVARFRAATTDANRGGAPRLDFCFIRVDGTVCRVHPGPRRSQDAQLKFD